MMQRVISLSVGDPIPDSRMECSYGMLRTPGFKRVSLSTPQGPSTGHCCVVSRWFSMTMSYSGVVLQFCEKNSEIKHFFWKNKALFRIKIFVNFVFIFQNVLLNHFYCMLFISWALVFNLTSVL